MPSAHPRSCYPEPTPTLHALPPCAPKPVCPSSENQVPVLYCTYWAFLYCTGTFFEEGHTVPVDWRNAQYVDAPLGKVGASLLSSGVLDICPKVVSCNDKADHHPHCKPRQRHRRTVSREAPSHAFVQLLRVKTLARIWLCFSLFLGTPSHLGTRLRIRGSTSRCEFGKY